MSTSSDDLAQKLEFYEIRDLLLGGNEKKQDVKRALELATTCRHPDARWLTKIFAGMNVNTAEEARDVFLAQDNYDDARAVCFAALAVDEEDHVLHAQLRKSAAMGCAFAEAELAALLVTQEDAEEEIFQLALSAASQGERDGFFWVGNCYHYSVGCEKSLEQAKRYYLFAIEMGGCVGPHSCVWSLRDIGFLFGESDPQRWHWWGEAAKQGLPSFFMNSFADQVLRFGSDPSLASAVFMIGRYLRGQIDLQKRQMFGWSYQFHPRVALANRAIDFFVSQCGAARKAVDTWCLMTVRINSKVNRDIRKKIGMLIWEAREKADYVIEQ